MAQSTIRSSWLTNLIFFILDLNPWIAGIKEEILLLLVSMVSSIEELPLKLGLSGENQIFQIVNTHLPFYLFYGSLLYLHLPNTHPLH
jgi:hypothetical protein